MINVMQDALKSTLEASVIPAFEMSCKAMFEQVDATFQKGIVEHTSAAQQHLESVHSPLALALRVCNLLYNFICGWHYHFYYFEHYHVPAVRRL